MKFTRSTMAVALGGQDAQDASLLAAVLARENDDRVALLDVRLVRLSFCFDVALPYMLVSFR